MDLKYAGSEVLQMAVEIEKKGKAFYNGLSETVKDDKARDMFRFLSDEEIKHQIFFQQMLESIETVEPASPYDNTDVTQYFRALIERRIFPTVGEGGMLKEYLDDLAVATRIAISMEKDSILFYYEIKPVVQAKDHSVLDTIINEEKKHIKILAEFAAELS